jgi:2-polyprenyl-3-methyl-5-hydroxy-6-metoxy-1,4-benzoquinol methylase
MTWHHEPVSYSPSDYWSDLHKRDDLSAVGQSGLPPEINRWLYRILARNLRHFLDRHDLLRRAPPRLFDVGAGTGEWIPFWRSLGVATVDGCDLVPEAVARLTTRFGDSGRFVRATLGDPADSALPSIARYPLVTVINVLLHVTDDAQFRTALGQVAGLVEPGGSLLLVEPILAGEQFARPCDPAAASRARPLAEYASPLEQAGLQLVDVRAATVLANNPIEAGSKRAFERYRRSWRSVSRRTKRDRGAARWIGPLLSVADRVAMCTGAAPSSKIALFRRPESA